MTLDLRSRERRAVILLLGACFIWGMGFNWNKQGQATLAANLVAVTGNPDVFILGPAWFLTVRFTLAALLWAIVFPRSWRGWSKSTIQAGASGGLFMASGMLLQHYGLTSTSEAVSAFLTSLTVLFTPIIAVFLLRQRVSGWLWASVLCATGGVGLMTLVGSNAGFDTGVLLGLLCAAAFSIHILIVDHFGKREAAWPLSLAQFLGASIVYFLFAMFYGSAHGSVTLSQVARACADQKFLLFLAMTTIPGTLVTFGIMFRFQPDMSPTRAALTYLSEPIFATIYARIASGSTVTLMQALGGMLIFSGNLLAELLGRKTDDTPPKSAPLEVAGPVLD